MDSICHQDLLHFLSDLASSKTGLKVYKKLMFIADLIRDDGKAIRITKHSKHIIGTRYDELLFDAANGVWRVLYVIDEEAGVAVVLAMGNKKGVKDSRFYKRLVLDADRRYEDYREWKGQGNGGDLFHPLK